MRFGCCAGPDNAEAAARAGFDFIELPAASVLQGDADGAEFAPMLAKLENLPLPVEAFNIFLPGDLKVVGPDRDAERTRRYLRHVMDRASAAGGKVVVFGSARSRNVPEGFDRDEAENQIAEFLLAAAPIAERYDVTIAIEPLNRGESNILNSVPEAIDLANRVSHPNVRALADLYHIAVENESLDHLLNAKGKLAHVHVADPDRRPPGSGPNAAREMFRHLKEIGYGGRISVECSWKDFPAEAPAAVEFLRRTWDSA
jgi:sugar phosphate isomerase/epimerase